MAYRRLQGAPFTGQDPERDDRENKVSLTQGERAKGTLEASWEDAMIITRCGATPDGNRYCYFPSGHSREEHSWQVVSSTESA